jgi:GAF domain-containing protein
MARLEDLYDDAAAALSPSDVAAMLVADSLSSLKADAGFLGTVSTDGRTLEVARVTPASKRPVRLAFPLDSSYPLAVAVRERHALFIASNEQLACDHPGLIRVDAEDHACATIPLFAGDGRLLGAVNVAFADPHEFSDDERALIEQLAERCAAAMSPPGSGQQHI